MRITSRTVHSIEFDQDEAAHLLSELRRVQDAVVRHDSGRTLPPMTTVHKLIAALDDIEPF